MVKAVMYAIGVVTLDRGCGTMDGEYLFHWVVWDGCKCGIWVAYWIQVHHSGRIRYKFMSIRYRRCA